MFKNGLVNTVCLVLMLCFFSLPAFAVEPDAPQVRPRVGLVLGGGGALGMAHVGVLKILEELRIPIDCIAGTSMGAIIGGLYAAGMSPGEIEALLLSMDWWEILDDQAGYRELSYRRKQENARYLLDMEIGFRPPWHFLVPSGIAAGQKLSVLMRRETSSVAAVHDFNELPVPYRAVATDLFTGEAVWLDSGDLVTAMRASMAVPGLFSPVKRNDRMLVDGGVVNNVPVDVALSMGAEIIIAVNIVAAKDKKLSERLSHFTSVISRTYMLMRQPLIDVQLKHADMVIVPNLVGHSAMDFHHAAAIMVRGEVAASALSTNLAGLSVSPAAYAEYQRRRQRPEQEEKQIVSVRIEGNERVDERVIRAKIRSRPGTVPDFDVLEKDVARVHGLGDFEAVSYRLEPSVNGHDVVYSVKEKAWGPGYLRAGLRINSDFKEESTWQFLMNYTRTRINPLGAELKTDFKIGNSKGAAMEFYQPLTPSGVFFIVPQAVAFSLVKPIYDGDHKLATYDFLLAAGGLRAGVLLDETVELSAGFLRGYGKTRLNTGVADLPEYHGDFAGLTLQGTVDTLDAPVFARSGSLLQGFAYFSRRALGAEDDYDKVSGKCDTYMAAGRHSLKLSFYAASSLNSRIPFYDRFALGGVDTIAGLSQDQLSGQYAAMAQVAYSYEITRLSPAFGRGVYVIFRQDAGNVWETRDDIAADDLRHSFSVTLSADTVIGPCGIGAALADRGNYQCFVSIGTIF